MLFRRVLAGFTAACLWVASGPAMGFSISSDQDIDSGGDIVGDGAGNTITPAGSDPNWTYSWTGVSTPGLSLLGNKLFGDDNDSAQGSITLDLNGGNINGDDTSIIRTYIGTAGAYCYADHLIITNVGDIAIGGIDTHANSVGDWNSQNANAGDVTIGSPALPAGDIRLGYLHAYNGSMTHTPSRYFAGLITIYGSGSVLIENSDASIRGDIRAHIWTGGTPSGADVYIRHNGTFRARHIMTYGDSTWSGGTIRCGDVTLDGGSATGPCIIDTVDTSWNTTSYGQDVGDLSISNYSAVTINNIYTDNLASNDAGHITIDQIPGNITITGEINAYSSYAAEAGNLLIRNTTSGAGTIALATLDLGKVKTATLYAANRRTIITGPLLGFDINNPSNGVLDALPGQAIFYSQIPPANAYLTGASYSLKSGGRLRSLTFGTVVVLR